MYILGINAYHGDASAALIYRGKLVAAAEEERFVRIKHCAGFPDHAIQYCLREAGIKPHELDSIAVARDPKARIYQKALYALKMPRLAIERLTVQQKFATISEDVARALETDPRSLKAKIHRVEHHKAHLASSFFVSGFDEAALLSADGLGDFASTMWGIGRGNKMEIGGATAFPHSLGIFYTAITQYLGFHRYGDEYKVMGLAAYGEPEQEKEFLEILKLPNNHTSENGLGFELGLQYFNHHRTGPEMTWKSGAPTLGILYSKELSRKLGPVREPGASVEAKHKNVAASLQRRLEDAMVHLLTKLHAKYQTDKLCLAGGVAFNCVVNGKILERTPFRSVYIPPAAGDAGLAIGAAFYVHHEVYIQPRSFTMNHAYWGPQFSKEEIQQAIRTNRINDGPYIVRELGESELVQILARKLADGKIAGWFQGRMEWGPRALGNRSILVDPRRKEMKEILNSRIKHRESFRPFAPSILEENVSDYFEQSHASPFMLMSYPVRAEKRSEIPAPTHVDGSGRLQTVSHETNPLYWNLIREFEKQTGVPVLLNTSFNDNEPVVCNPSEAIDCFLRTKMDLLAIGPILIEKIP